MIDLHNHILPGVDDGPKTLEASRDMARALVSAGITTVCATPHTTEWSKAGNAARIRQRVAELSADFQDHGIAMDLLAGGEVHLTPGLAQEVASEAVPTLNGTQYLLLEFPYEYLPPFYDRIVFELQVGGIRPVIAHPERIAPIAEDPGILYQLVHRGCLAQLTAASLAGLYGSKLRDLSDHMLEHNLVHLIATDAHDAGDDGRLPALPEARARAIRLLGESRGTALFEGTPAKIIAGENVEPEPALEIKKRMLSFPLEPPVKALILSGGKATRLRPITYTSAKQLVPVANKPVLFYAIESVVNAGITDIGIVVGHTKDEVMAAVGDGSRWNAKVTYIEQPEPKGLAHAVLISEEFIGQDKFVLFLGDNFLKGGIQPFVNEFERGNFNALIILTHVANPSEMGVAVVEGDRIVRLLEKPKNPPSDLGIVGIYLFDKTIFEAARAIKPSWRNELEITDAMQHLIDAKLDVRAQIITDQWIDTGKKDDMLDVNRVILADLRRRIDGRVTGGSEITGNVVIEAGAEVEDSTIRGPAIIGPGSRVVRSYVGPFTSIYHDVLIEDSEIENSIVLENTQIRDAGGRIDRSLIGRDVRIQRGLRRPSALTLMLGDHSQVELV